MTASTATLTVDHGGNVRTKRFTTTLAANAEDGVEVSLGWSKVLHCTITHVSDSPVQSGMSYKYASGVLTLYGAAASNLLDGATVTVEVQGTD